MSLPGEALRVGVVGTGSLGFHHARILRDLPDVRMEGVFEVRTGRAQEVARELDVTAHSAMDALLDRVDAVVVAVPTVEHEGVALAALARGIHVMVEKPMAPDLEAADRILKASKASGARVQIGHVERFNPAILAADEYLEEPLFIESLRIAPFVPRSTDVAVVLDLMIHDVDLVQSLVHRPIADIAAAGLPVLTPNVDIANARLTFEGGAVANLTASRISLDRKRELRIFQRSGYLSLNLADGTGEFLRLKEGFPLPQGGGSGAAPAVEVDAGPVIPEGGLEALVERIPLEGEKVEPLRRELENFRDACLGRGESLVSGEDGRAALDVTLSIEERIRSHVSSSSTP
ncbi:Gfo/Idh/MocA family oxidoreductase [Gemmatimonadota bacterium]